MLRLGELYAGIGGLTWSVESALGCTTVWQLDLVGAAVRRRHWPDALQVEADVATVDPLDLPRIDVLCGGFSCQDLSCAGTQHGLVDGTRTGPTYRGLTRFAAALRPEIVVMENVPALLTRWRAHLEQDWRRLGYGLTWVRARALDVGAPHLRRRVFVVAVRGGVGGEVLDAPREGEWVPARDAPRTWGTPRCGNEGYGWGQADNRGRLEDQTRVWATPAARDHKMGELSGRVGTEALNQQVTDYPRAPHGTRLSADWVEPLMGFSTGWTLPEGPRQEIDLSPRWPRGRYPAGWDRSVLWPGYDWEPPRTLPDGPPCPGRPARIRALGAAVVPQQGLLAIRAALDCAQGSLGCASSAARSSPDGASTSPSTPAATE